MQNRVATIDFADKDAGYRELASMLSALLAGESELVANAANTAALLAMQLPELNWVGFYLLRPGPRGPQLVLGPFQGRPACVRIELGAGVCGTAAVQRQTIRVDDVHAFAGHIACDPVSASEIVVPVMQAGELLGVLDLDSPRKARFDARDQTGLEEIVRRLVAALDR